MQQDRAGIGVQRIDRVAFGSDIDDVVDALTGDGLPGQDQRLRIDLIVERSETRHLEGQATSALTQHRVGRQNRLRRVPACAVIVVMIGRDVDLGLGVACCKHRAKGCCYRTDA